MVEGLDGKVAIVTGAGRGLGRAEALELARHGVRVLVNDYGRSLFGEPEDSPADEVVSEIKAMGGDAVANYGDVADWDTAKGMIERAVAEWGQLDIVVNNAGFLKDRVLFNMSEEEFDSVVRVHLKGHFCMLRHATAHWREVAKAEGSVYGRVINTGSESGLAGSVGQPNYGPAKAGILALTMNVAQLMERYGITANAICPRARTRMTEATPSMQPTEGAFDTYAVENVTPLVAYLASPAAQNVSGQVFVAWGRSIRRVGGQHFSDAFESDEAWTSDSVAASLTPFFADKRPVHDGYRLVLEGEKI